MLEFMLLDETKMNKTIRNGRMKLKIFIQFQMRFPFLTNIFIVHASMRIINQGLLINDCDFLSFAENYSIRAQQVTISSFIDNNGK